MKLHRNARSKEDLTRALEQYEHARKIFESAGYLSGLAAAYYNLGYIYDTWGDFPSALEFQDKVLSIARELLDPKMEAGALNDIGSVYGRWGKYDRAAEHLEKAAALYRKIGDRPGEWGSLNNLGNIYLLWGQYDKAGDLFQTALTFALQSGDLRREAQCLHNLGTVHSAKDQYAEAARFFESALAAFWKLGDEENQARSLGSLGMVHAKRGRHTQALDSYQKALAIRRKLGDMPGVETTLTALGITYRESGLYAHAAASFEDALAIARKIDSLPGERSALHNLAGVYEAWGQYARAIDTLEKSLALAEQTGSVSGEANTLSSLGFVYSQLGYYTKALASYDKALSTRRKLGERREEGRTVINVGTVYATWGRRREALDSFQEGLRIYREIGIPTDRPENLISDLYLDMGELDKAASLLGEHGSPSILGRLCLLRLSYEKAIGYYEQVQKYAELNRDASNLFTAHTGLGTAYEGIGDLERAAEHFRKAVAFTEELRSSLKRSQRERFFDVRVNGFYRTAPYKGLARVLLRLQRPEEAFKHSEYTKARVFAESMSNPSADQVLDLPADVFKRDLELNDRLAALNTAIQKAYEANNVEIVKSLEPQKRELREQIAEHKRFLREKYPLFAATRYPDPMDLEHTCLEDREWVLAYDVTDSGLVVYLTQGKKIVKAVFRPINKTDLVELVRKFRSPLDVTASDNLTEKLQQFNFASGKKIADLLLSDILPDLPEGAQLIVVPDDILGGLPFEILLLSQDGKVIADEAIPQISGAHFFGDRNPISYYQSVNALTLSRNFRKHKPASKKCLVMDDPIFGPDDVRIKRNPEARDSASTVRVRELLASIRTDAGLTFPRLPLTADLGLFLQEFDPRDTVRYTGIHASKEVLLRKTLDDYETMVLATHGYFLKDLPGIQEPVLILTLVNQPEGRDGFLRMSEVMGLKLNADLAALTACQSGLGVRVSGEGTMGMGRAFQYAGAKSVLMSLWSVAERSSVKLVQSFFRHTKEGKSKLTALKAARDEIRLEGYDHPFFWAAFILVGEAE